MALALPLALVSAGSGQAAPTLTIAQAQQQLSALQTQQDVAVEAYNSGQIALTDAQRRLRTAQSSEQRQQTTVNAARTQLAQFARAAYISDGIDPVTGLLAGQGPQHVLDRVSSLNEVARARSSRATALQSEQSRLAAIELINRDRLKDTAQAQKKLEADRAAVGALIEKQQGVLNRLQVEQRRALEAQQAAERAAAAKAAEAAPASIAALSSAPPATSAQASRGTSRAGLSPIPTPVPARVASSNVASTVLAAAYSQRGKTYVYGAAGPNAYDCSGLILWAFARAGISLPHSAAAQYGYGTHVPVSQLQPGDLVFFVEGGSIGHNGIYAGGGKMIDANHTGGWVDLRSMQGYPGLIGGTRITG